MPTNGKIRRVRPYTAEDIGRIVCYAIEDGAEKADIRKELKRCMGKTEECDCERAKNLIKIALSVFAYAAVALALKNPIARAMNTIVRAALKSPNKEERLLAGEALKGLEDLTKTIEGNYRRIADEAETVFAEGITAGKPRDIIISP
jgi:hypothetical protein